jgi:N-acetylneuraminate synthase
MIVDRNIAKYIVFAEDTILNALRKISDNKNRVVFSVTESGELEGILTDGDFRRWLVDQRTIDLNQPVSAASNKNFQYAGVGDDPERIAAAFSDRIEYIPLLDRQRHLVAVARRRGGAIAIGSFTISAESPCFVIAEIGNNHNGSVELARRLVDLAIEAGADCAKFQMRSMRALYGNAGDAADAAEDLGAQYTLDLLSRFQLSHEQLCSVFDYCKQRGIIPLCTPWDRESLAVLERYGMQAYKVASADLTNHDLLEALARTTKPLICSTGMSTEAEIIDAVRLLRRHNAQYVLLHCNSTYPAPFKDINLGYLDRLKAIGDCPVGYSGHERGIAVAIAAVSRGAKVVEKHFTIDRNLEGNDHRVSLLPDEFKVMVQGIREVEQAMGGDAARRVSQGEMMNREVLGKSLVARCDIRKGQTIGAEMIDVKSPGKGLAPYRKGELIGRHAPRDVKAGDFFYPSDVDAPRTLPRAYRFKRPFGVPVRYHDAVKLAALSNLGLLEFHLSYKDLEADYRQYLRAPFDLDLVVHSPELFAGDHIMDLCSSDPVYRRRSIDELQRVIDVTRALMPLFKRATRPLIVINAGGFTLDAPLPASERAPLYDLIFDSLSRVDAKGVEIIPQTMPPFPWHFGGQRFHNLFVDAADIAAFCRDRGHRVCLDISHSKLACNHHKWSFQEFLAQAGPFAAHLHVVDAAGVDGEGLQIGEGDIDFKALGDQLNRVCPRASFVPEIWQGHKNDGEGFWYALERLEQFF